jgi:uncharacterized protein YdaU (DUF1376 family)
MGSAPPAFQFYASDWLASVSSLTLEERGAYITLLAWSWEHGGVPNDMKRIAAILGTHLNAARRIWVEVCKRWSLTDDGDWRNGRLERVRANSEAFRQKQAKKGKASAAARAQASTAVTTTVQPRLVPRHQPQGQPDTQPDTQPEVNPPISDLRSPSPRSKPAVSRKHSQDARAYTAEFLEFWNAYPKHAAKPEAFDVWQRLAPSLDLKREIFAALEWQTKQPGWLENGGQFVPQAQKWLRNRRWEDEPFAPQVDESEAAFLRVVAGKGRLA